MRISLFANHSWRNENYGPHRLPSHRLLYHFLPTALIIIQSSPNLSNGHCHGEDPSKLTLMDPNRAVQFSVRDRTGPDRSSSVRSSVREIEEIGPRSDPGLDRRTGPRDRTGGYGTGVPNSTGAPCQKSVRGTAVPYGTATPCHISSTLTIRVLTRLVLDRSGPVRGPEHAPLSVFGPGRFGPVRSWTDAHPYIWC